MPKSTNYKKKFLDTITAPVTIARSAGNYLAHLTTLEIFGTHFEESIEKYHSPRARAQILRENVAGIKTKALIGPLDTAISSIDNHLKTLNQTDPVFASSIDKLQKQIADAAGNPMALAGATAKLRHLRALKSSLVPPLFDLTEFKNRFQELKDLLKNDEVDDPRVIIEYIESQYEKLITQLNHSKTTALNAIKTKIEEAKASGLDYLTHAELDTLAAELTKKVHESFDKAKTELETDFTTGKPGEKEGDKGTPGLISNLKKAAEKAEYELVNMVLFSEKTHSKQLVSSELTMGTGSPLSPDDPRKYRKTTFEEYVAYQPERSNSFFSLTAWQQYASFLMNGNAELYTLGGLKFKQTGDGGISISFPFRFSPYFFSPDNLLGADLMLMINQIKASGKASISFTINCDDPGMRQKMMEELYYAAKMAGYPDDNIKFTVNYAEDTKEEKQSIQSEPASKILGRLGSAPQRAAAKQEAWKKESQILKQESTKALNRGVEALSDLVEERLKRNGMSASIIQP